MPKRLVAGFVVAGRLLAGCAGRGPQLGVPGATAVEHGSPLTVAIGLDPDTLATRVQSSSTSRPLAGMVVEPLVTIDGRGEVRPLLATRWQEPADGLSYRCTLRGRVRFNCDAQKAIWDDAPWIFLQYPKLPVVTTAGVVGVTMLPNEQFDTVYARPT